ncbi:proline dehydrogenase family protein [Deinococcus radiophilus]|uniref:proline dehydrogenase n=1 Tax=Deinococcus radiophilus TaxID=32062 RepID=A0A3S0IDN3_9DEIO|nr:proline dehydrogenase family protein [Deinococcus radiophilus]RTR30271.1 proline dehydrogenase [Deinococcus radiophilus]UFA49934.1 proline dehydrogenase family protein [Deinococcus radiophilus]
MSQFDQLYRQVALSVATHPVVEKVVSKQGWALAQRFVSGESAEDAIEAIKRLEQSGILGNLDLLGEFVTTPEPANQNTELILQAMDKVHAAGLTPYNSIKLSSIGQGQQIGGQDLGDVNARRIVARAKQYGGFVNLDMEDHPRVDETLRLFRELVQEFGNQHVGTVLQAYLHRTEEDRRSLDDLKPNLRIVKGAYLEPESVAMQDKAEIDAAYRRLVYEHLQAGNYCNVATHDHNIIYDVMHFELAHGIPKSQFEFQLLYGIREDLQRELAAQGYTVRSYIPFGKEWYGYYSRRIAERPKNVLFVLRGLI